MTNTSPPREQFSSRLGFVMAAAGSAVGLGNIWAFPTLAASNGGAAFLLVYLVLAFCLAYPALMAELIIGRHAHGNMVTALRHIAPGPASRRIGTAAGIYGFLVASFILSFYAIVAGWMMAYFLQAAARLAKAPAVAAWLVEFGFARNFVFMAAFMWLTIAIVARGVAGGIERWSNHLMPLLLLMLLALVAYVLTLPGAIEGLKVYLLPDLDKVLDIELVLKALGASFFSLSVGCGTMLIYGSYVSDSENLPRLGGVVTLVDTGIAVLAGFLVLPAMYVALDRGVPIFDAGGALLSEDTLIFTVLPALFDTMGVAGLVVALVFFTLMTIAALTSSISMLEAPVAYAIENHGIARRRAAWGVGMAIAAASTMILLDFQQLFGPVVAITTRYSEPALGLLLCVYAGWLWRRDQLLVELRKGNPGAEHGLFWKIWPWYVKFVCPLAIAAIFVQSIWR